MMTMDVSPTTSHRSSNTVSAGRVQPPQKQQNKSQSSLYIQGGIPQLRKHPVTKSSTKLLRSNTLPTKINSQQPRVLSGGSESSSRNSRNSSCSVRHDPSSLQKRDSLESNRSDNSDPGMSSTQTGYAVSRTATVGGQIRRGVITTSMREKISAPAHTKHRSRSLENEASVSTPSIILTKMRSMKEKFQRQVVQTVQIGDWPPPSILFQERHAYSSSVPSTIRRKRVERGNLERSNSSVVTRGSTKTNSEIGTSRNSMISDALSTKSLSSTGGNGGIVCSELDLKAIIVGFRQQTDPTKVGASKTTSTVTVEDRKRTQSESKLNESHKSSHSRKGCMRKQVSFDDKERVISTERKVSAIAEEIEAAMGENFMALCARRGSGKKEDLQLQQQQKTKKTMENDSSDDTDDLNSLTEMDDDSSSHVASSSVAVEKEPTAAELDEDNDSKSSPILPPKEVEYDEFGQTWEVYGADPDPEILGQAIQHHLEHLMIHHKSFKTDGSSSGDDRTETDLLNNNGAGRSKGDLADESSTSGFKRFWSRLFCVADRGTQSTASAGAEDIPTKRAMYDTQVC